MPEGVDLLPYLTGSKTGAPHERLFWRAGGGARSAVREGDWKLVQGEGAKTQLFNLAADIAEAKDVSAEQPAVLARLQAAYAEWDKANVKPIFESQNPAGAKKGKK